MVVGHSAASTLAWLAADARPQRVAEAEVFDPADSRTLTGRATPTSSKSWTGPCRSRGWEPFEGADTADLDQAMKARIAEATIPVPEGVSKAVVRLSDERRYDVPAVLVCPEFTPAEVCSVDRCRPDPRAGQGGANLELIDIVTGHWPMISTPCRARSSPRRHRHIAMTDRAAVRGGQRAVLRTGEGSLS